MTTIKIQISDSEVFIRKVNCAIIPKILLSTIIIIVAASLTNPVFAQNNKDTTTNDQSSNGDDIFQQMLDYSSPGQYHQLLAELVGTWVFKGRRFPLNPDSSKVKFDLFGFHVRKSFAEGRYFVVDMTMGDSLHKILTPIQDGKMKEVIGKGITIEGYDNVKKKFVQTSITNHIGSDIVFWEGSYDSTTKTITFDSVEEIVPGLKDEIRELFILNNKDNYTLEYYHKENNVYVKDSEVILTRVKEK
jgi:hypothetical protein